MASDNNIAELLQGLRENERIAFYATQGFCVLVDIRAAVGDRVLSVQTAVDKKEIKSFGGLLLSEVIRMSLEHLRKEAARHD